MQQHNQRVFPRIDLQCPISYRDQVHKSWTLSRLVDFSADGLLMVTDHPLPRGEQISIQIRPGNKKIMRGYGNVVRCIDKGNKVFHIAVNDIHWQPSELNTEQVRHIPDRSDEQRSFPRFKAECPVRFRDDETRRWLVGRMLDFSATGLMMLTDYKVKEGTPVEFHVERGSKKQIPAISGTGVIARCKLLEKSKYEIAIKMLKVGQK